MLIKPYVHLLLPCAFGLHVTVWAQTAPDAGSIRQQIEQPREQRLPAASPAQRSQAPSPVKAQPGLTVTLRSVRIAGNRLLSTEQLAPATAAFLNRPLAFADLQRAADAVAAAYQGAGWVVRVYLPEQDLGSGELTLQVVEARYGGQRFEGAPPARVDAGRVEALFNAAQAVGEPLSATAIDRALLLADDLPGLSIAGTLVAGPRQGETSLLLRASDDAPVSGDVGLDNFGARSTGATRITAGLTLASPFGQGEQFGLNLLHSRGNDYGRAALALPVGAQGLRLGLSASTLRYRIIEGPGHDSAAQIRGSSGSVGADLNYPLLRSRLHNLFLSAALDDKSFLTRDLALRSDYRSRTVSVGLAGNRFDELGAGGAISGSVQLLWGRLGSVSQHPLGDGIGRQYRKISYSLSRQQAVVADHSVWLGVTGQHATQVLDSSEKFYIGGAGSVRAYPATELGGERGRVLSGEWRWRVRASTVLSAFTDWGQVTTVASVPGQPEARLRLRGHGLSAAWQGPAGLALKATWARRSGSNPMTTASGADGDGTRRLNRLWLSASLSF